MNRFEIAFGIVTIINCIIYFITRLIKKKAYLIDLDDVYIVIGLFGIIILVCGIFGG